MRDVVGLSPDRPLPTVDGGTLLQWCAYYGDVGSLRELLAAGCTLTDLGKDLGLIGAAFHGHWQLCEFLIAEGADARYHDPGTGETALHAALTNEDRERYDRVVAVLLRAGADPNAATVPGQSTGAFMRDAVTRGETPLHRAAAFASASSIERLRHAGADPERTDCHGETALAWASWYRRPTDVLWALLYGPHRIHPAHTPMRSSLIGRPLEY